MKILMQDRTLTTRTTFIYHVNLCSERFENVLDKLLKILGVFSQVIILETGVTGVIGIGVAHEDFDTSEMPGWNEQSLGYHSNDGNIYYKSFLGRKTKGLKAMF